MSDTLLSSQQLAVISALSSGATLTAAAEEAGVHRNTINYWRRNLINFQNALAHAQYDRALYYRDRIEAEADLAIQSLHNLLADPKTPASVRLKAALTVIQTASTPPLPKPHVVYAVESVSLTDLMTKSAQTAPPSALTHDPQQAPPPATATQVAPGVHKSAQTAPAPIRREAPKVGRNQACPCGSGKKYKRCCLDQPSTAPSVGTAAA
jgi:transposase-like protein